MNNLIAAILVLWIVAAMALFALVVVVTRVVAGSVKLALKLSWPTVFAPIALGVDIYDLIHDRPPRKGWLTLLSAPFTMAHMVFWPLYFGGLL